MQTQTDFEMEGAMKRQKEINRKPKTREKDDLLLPLLARVSTAESRQLLKNHGIDDAKGFDDLEIKLAQLYTNSPDKIAIEKEFAAIHPHKNWLFKTIPPEIKPVETIDMTTKTIETSDFEGGEKKSGCSGGCSGCKFSSAQNLSSFDGSQKQLLTTNNTIELLAIVAVIGLTFYFLKHN